MCYFVQAPSSIKTPEKIEGEDTMPPYDAETQALIDGQYDSLTIFYTSVVPLYLFWTYWYIVTPVHPFDNLHNKQQSFLLL